MMELTGLSKSFGGVAAVDDVTLTIRDDEYLTLLGPSGSGKSTLLRLIAGLERPDAGQITLNGVDLAKLPTHRRGLGIVQQNYALFPHLTVFENVAFGLRWRETDPVKDESVIQQRVAQVLALVGLEGLDGRAVGQLSGGQKQRVSLARTLVTEPKLCLLDEPLGALDANLRERMTFELKEIRDKLGVTFLHVTGNEAEAMAMGDRMIVLDQGKIASVAPPTEIFAAPATLRLAQILSAYNILPGVTQGGVFHHGGADLPMPFACDAAHYGVRFDATSIVPADDPSAHLQAEFIASEFTGNGVTYFLRGPLGVIEVERHLSWADPVDYGRGDMLGLTWDTDDVHLFDSQGALLVGTAQRGAA